MFTATIQIRLVGTSPLMMCRITDAAMQQMINKSRSSIKVKESRDPRDIAGELLYAVEGKPFLPKSNLRAAVIQAGTYMKVGKKQLTNKETSIIPSFFHITTERAMLVHPDDAKKPAAWEVDMRPITLQSGGKDIAIRPRIDVWACDVEASFDPDEVNDSTIRTLFDYAGTKIGVGVFRIERKGDFGQFRVDGWKVTKKDAKKAA